MDATTIATLIRLGLLTFADIARAIQRARSENAIGHEEAKAMRLAAQKAARDVYNEVIEALNSSVPDA